jgi:GxxExxY protein
LGRAFLSQSMNWLSARNYGFDGYPWSAKSNLPIHYKGAALECSVKLDLLIQRRIIVEVKSVESINNVHKAQLLTYLRLKNLWLGLLINFNVEVLRDGVKRILNG